MLEARAADVAELRGRATRCLAHRLDRGTDELRHTVARLRALSPAATLERGYAIVQRGDGAVVRRPDEVRPGDALRLRLAGGELPATVAES
jgi:exodeoxyribonuclease VII large subunit